MVEINVTDMVNRIGTLTDQIKALCIAENIATTLDKDKPITMSQKQCREIIKSLEQYRDLLADRANTTMIYF